VFVFLKLKKHFGNYYGNGKYEKIGTEYKKTEMECVILDEN